MLSDMASEKSIVYVVFSFSESRSATVMNFPRVFISGISICGGDTTTFSAAFSSFTNSLKYMRTLRSFTPVPLSAGVVPTTYGGVSSYHPPSGEPIRAHDTTATAMAAISNRDSIMEL